MTAFHQPQAIRDHGQKVHVVAHQNDRAAISRKRIYKRLTRFNIEVVRRLVEDQQMRGRERGKQQRQTRFLST